MNSPGTDSVIHGARCNTILIDVNDSLSGNLSIE